MQTKEITELFKQNGIKATAQRIAVYKYLYENRIHPDVDTVYKNMVKDNPSFQKLLFITACRRLPTAG
ncbi:MAG: transcriptional repressor [Eubacterium sp.]